MTLETVVPAAIPVPVTVAPTGIKPVMPDTAIVLPTTVVTTLAETLTPVPLLFVDSTIVPSGIIVPVVLDVISIPEKNPSGGVKSFIKVALIG